jgi:hypothetical protein
MSLFFAAASNHRFGLREETQFDGSRFETHGRRTVGKVL